MKRRLLCLMMIAMLTVPTITGCRAARKVQSAGRAVERGVESAAKSMTETTRYSSPALTLEEAKNIALKHAGLTANEVTALHAEYEIEHGTPKYEVDFHHGQWEYDYDLHADTGDILSFSKEVDSDL